MLAILSGIHCYLGLHVLKREIIFIDLSLAQISALGASIGLLLHYEHHSLQAYALGFVATLLASGLFAWMRKHEKVISQEVVIGTMFAFASAAIILVVDQLAHGAEHIKESLVGKILWVTWDKVFITGAIYLLVGGIHYTFREQFFALSEGRLERKHFYWDFIFYALFGLVITCSTGTVGILLVFTLLIVPASIGKLFYQSLKARLLFGWFFSIAIGSIGFLVSYLFDLPAGAVIVLLFSLSLCLSLLGK